MQTLQRLLTWAHAEYIGELPQLQHKVNEFDEGGAAEMAPAAKAYLGLQGKKCEPQGPQAKKLHADCRNSSVGCLIELDNWARRAWRRDEDGHLRTPLHAALTKIDAPKLQRLLRDILPELYFPTEILVLHGYTERWEQNGILKEAMTILAREYRDLDRVRARPAYIDMSESQQKALDAA